MASFNGKTPVNFDKIYTPLEVIQKCNRFLAEILVSEGAEIDQIIDPAAGPNIWINDLVQNYFDGPVQTYSLDIAPDNDQVRKFDWLKLKDKELKYSEYRLIVTNPPYGGRNYGTTSFINIALKHAKWVAMLVPTGTWTSIRIRNFNRRWKIDIGPINQVFKGCGIFNENTNSCNISFIVYESANDPKKKLELPYGNILDDEEKHYKVSLKHLGNGGARSPLAKDYRHLFQPNDIFCCALGLGCLFKPCDPFKYSKILWIRFHDKDLRQQYLSLDFKALNETWKSIQGRTSQTMPWRWFEFISSYINLNPEE